MTVFLNTKKLDQGYFKPENFFREMKSLHIVAKAQTQKCDHFLKSLEENDPAQAEELYLRVAKIWREKSGSISFEEDCLLGKRLSRYHMDDPFVHRTVLDFMEMEDSPFESSRACVRWISKGITSIQTLDLLETKFLIYLPENPTEQFLKDAARAAEAASYAARKIPFSANYHRPNGIQDNGELKAMLKEIEVRTIAIQKKCIEKTSREYLLFIENTLPNFFEETHKQAKMLEKVILGNCNELAASTFGYLLKERSCKKADAVKLVGIGGGNHILVVVGKAVADPWARAIYPTSQIPELLHDFKGTDDLYCPKLKKFNPNKQSLIEITSNIHNVRSFRDISSEKVPEVEAMLKEFHSISEDKQKKAQAQKILGFIEQSPHFQILKNEGLSALFSQLHYLINDHPFDVLNHPVFFGLKMAEEANNPQIFYEAMDTNPLPEFGIINLGLWMTYRTNNFDFLKAAIELGARPNKKTFFIASWMAIKKKNIKYLTSVVKIGAQTDPDSFQRLVSLAQKTGDLTFLRSAIEAGVELDSSTVEALVKEALATGNADIINLFGTKTKTSLLISCYLEILRKN